MSFGFGVGDLVAGANLAYKLYQALSETQGSARDYQSLMSELLIVHKVLLQVDQLRVSNQLAQSTLNAILFLTNGMNEAMDEFMLELEKYRDGLQIGGSGNAVKDIYLKGKWAIKMPDEVRRVCNILNSNLLSLSILIQMACYFNAEYKPEYGARFHDVGQTKAQSAFPYVGISALIIKGATSCASPSFAVAPNPIEFFRPGQVFSVAIESTLYLQGREKEWLNWTHLPLEWIPLDSIPDLHEREKERDVRRKQRLNDILKLPLDAMFKYGTILGDGHVLCNLCDNNPLFKKDYWVDRHFRVQHHKEFQKLQDDSTPDHRMKYIPPNEIGTDSPVLTEEEVKRLVDHLLGILGSVTRDPWIDSIMIRRFVVVRQGTESCLCLGIHTYAGRGCSDQPDQELFAVLHGSKHIPPPLEGEAGIRLQPIRLKAEHPSTALPSSARVHFGRVYEIKHDVNLKSIGLIHDSSMETLLSQFELHCPINARIEPETGSNVLSTDSSVADATVSPVNINIVKEIRDNIKSALAKTQERHSELIQKFDYGFRRPPHLAAPPSPEKRVF